MFYYKSFDQFLDAAKINHSIVFLPDSVSFLPFAVSLNAIFFLFVTGFINLLGFFSHSLNIAFFVHSSTNSDR